MDFKLAVITVIFVVFNFNSSESRLSGLKAISSFQNKDLPQRMVEFHQQILKRLETHTSTESSIHQSSSYMMELYQKKSDLSTGQSPIFARSSRQHRDSLKQNGRERAALRRSDIIRSFSATESQVVGETLVVSFDLSAVKSRERIRFSEMRMKTSELLKDVDTIVIREQVKVNAFKNLGSVQINSKRISSAKKITLDTTSIIRRWYRANAKNSASFSDDVSSLERTADELDSSVDVDFTLVIFSNNEDYDLMDATNERQNRFRRESGHRHHHERQRRRRQKNKKRNKIVNEDSKNEIEETVKAPEHPIPERLSNTPIHCRKVAFEVDFDKIGWGEWIIYPRRYNAYRCEGTCNVAVMQQKTSTNHAYVQSMFSTSRPDLDIPLPCCVPTKLKPLSLLYFENGEVVQRDHEEMVVEECGCR